MHITLMQVLSQIEETIFYFLTNSHFISEYFHSTWILWDVNKLREKKTQANIKKSLEK